MSASDTKATKALPTMPTKADISAWDALTREEQLAALRAELDHPDCKRESSATLEEIRQAGQAATARLRAKDG
jgi:hypothetical protein